MFLSGRENVGLRRLHLCHALGPVPRHARLQHVQRRKPIHGPLVPHVCEDLHLHELVINLFQPWALLQYGLFFVK